MKYLLFVTTFLLTLMLSQPSLATHPGGAVYAEVNGLVCDFCARALEKVFTKQKEVDSIHVDLNTKIIAIHFKQGQQLDDKKITQLITDSGYNVRKIRHEK